MLCALAARDLRTMAALAAVARQGARSLDRITRMQENQRWERWLRGDDPSSSGRGGQPTKRAFMFVRGAVGWTRSPVG